MFIDEVDNIVFEAGHGGAGRVSFHRPPERGPDGGNGGKGGDLYLKTVEDSMAMTRFAAKKEFQAAHGEKGGCNHKSGRDGRDLYLDLPMGTDIFDQNGQKILVMEKPGLTILFCRGGLGGQGNFEFRSSVNTTPKYAQPGLAGEKKTVRLVLKLIADYGLVGLPNAGKSSLLNVLTKARVKVAAYPFTTLEPNLGVLNGKIIADIPGLIAGASTGRGLGIKFLKHIEKVALLLHCLSAESEDLIADYQTVRQELANYSHDLINKTEIILLTKSDLINQTALKEQLATLRKLKKKVLPVSIYDEASLKKLAGILSDSEKFLVEP
ncbi:MAG: GTPase ObgE [Candidatus Shapirobacteria bacterium]